MIAAVVPVPDETTKGLVDLGHARNLVDPAKGCFAAEPGTRGFGKSSALHGVNLGQRGADHHGMRDTSAEQVDALGETGAEHQEERITEQQ